MSKASLGHAMLMPLLAIGVCLSGCAASTPHEYPEIRQSASPALKEHQRKQRLRAIEGNYKRLYRPKDCRRTPNCDGFPRMTPSHATP
jgi:hypothetical protein